MEQHDYQMRRDEGVDGAAVASAALLIACLAWTITLFVVAATFEPCDGFGQCVLALNVLLLWLYPHALAAIPGAIGVFYLYRRLAVGESTLPKIGFAALGLNLLLSFALFCYLTTLPFGFR